MVDELFNKECPPEPTLPPVGRISLAAHAPAAAASGPASQDHTRLFRRRVIEKRKEIAELRNKLEDSARRSIAAREVSGSLSNNQTVSTAAIPTVAGNASKRPAAPTASRRLTRAATLAAQASRTAATAVNGPEPSASGVGRVHMKAAGPSASSNNRKRDSPGQAELERPGKRRRLLVPIGSSSTNSTRPTVPLPGAGALAGVHQAPFPTIIYEMPTSITETEVLPSNAYSIVTPSDEAECTICMNRLCEGDEPTAQLECGHRLHLGCLTEAAKRKTACPVCRKPFQQETPIGHMPSGTMACSRSPHLTCSGFAPGSIVIRYSFASGTQQVYHPNPGQRYHGTTRVAYLPDSSEGRDLLRRLQEAFRHGLTFAIGTSLTSGRDNVCTWVSIPHKTRACGGAHGFPDGNYFHNCNAALDNLHVKRAQEVESASGSEQQEDSDTLGAVFI